MLLRLLHQFYVIGNLAGVLLFWSEERACPANWNWLALQPFYFVQ